MGNTANSIPPVLSYMQCHQGAVPSDGPSYQVVYEGCSPHDLQFVQSVEHPRQWCRSGWDLQGEINGYDVNTVTISYNQHDTGTNVSLRV